MEGLNYEHVFNVPTVLKFDSIMHINVKPHQFMVTAKHVAYASDNCSGILDERALNAVPCGVSGCNLSYAEHRGDTVIAIRALTDEQEVLGANMYKLLTDEVKEQMRKDNIEGFVFIEGGKDE